MCSILVTGSSGFVGTNLVPYLKSNIEGVTLKCVPRTDLSNLLALSGYSCFIHLAGKAHDVKNTSAPEEYYQINTDLTIKIFDAFVNSSASIFIFLSSVKAAADFVNGELTENIIPKPSTHYGMSKLKAEQYILSQSLPEGKKVFILRPCMIHGTGNKGNMQLLYKIIEKGIVWPLGSFENKRSFCSIDNICFIIKELIVRPDIQSGVYNIADDGYMSTNQVVKLIGLSLNKKAKIIAAPKFIIHFLAYIGDLFHLGINSDRLSKLTENYLVSNEKITKAIGLKLPLGIEEGLVKTFKSFNS